MIIEQTTLDPHVQAIDRMMLDGLVRDLLNSPAAVIVEWHVDAINPGMGSATGGMYRVAGSALVDGREAPWSMILKVVGLAASAFNPASREMDHPLYWEREALAYESGLLEGLPGGLAAPRCLAVMRRRDETLWLWMEEARDRYGSRWPLEQYADAARCLGRFNGAYLAGQPLPAYPWLCISGTLRGMLDHFAGVNAVMTDPRTWELPLVRRALSAADTKRMRRLWFDRRPLLDALERLPRTLCHKDAWRQNMFAPPGADGSGRLMMIDWAYVGHGELGLDAGDLFAASYSLFGVEPCDPHELDQVVFANYLKGLRQAGWHGDRRMARFGYAAYAALKYGSVNLWLLAAENESGRANWERMSGHPLEDIVESESRLLPYLLDLADEARELIDA